MPIPYWLRSARYDQKYRSVSRRLTDLERKMETIMADIDDLKASESDLEGAVADAIDDIHSLNTQLQSQIVANAQNSAVPEGIKAVAAALAAATTRLRAALPTKSNPAPEPPPVVDPAASQAAQDEANAKATNDTVGQTGAQAQAQADAGSVAGVGGPAPTPESLGEVTAEGDPAPGTTREATPAAAAGSINGEPATAAEVQASQESAADVDKGDAHNGTNTAEADANAAALAQHE